MRFKLSIVAVGLATVFFSAALGEIEHLVITADNILNRVCVNGTDRSSSLVNNKRIPKFDTIPLGEPGTWQYVTIEGTNLKHGWAGFLAWQTATTPTALAKWQCMPMSDVPGGNCCGVSPDDPGWSPSRDWLKLNQHRNRNFKSKVPSRVTHWFWSSKIKQSHICCISQKCDDVCARCTTPGPGNCNECLFGSTSATDPVTSVTTTNRCKYKCHVDLSAAATTGPESVVKITNAASGKTTTVVAQRTHVMFWIDVTTCQPTEVSYADSFSDPTPTTQFNVWTGAANYTNLVAVRLWSHVTPTPGDEPISLIGIWTLRAPGTLPTQHVKNGFTNVKFWINTFPNEDPGLQDSDFSDRTPSDLPLQPNTAK